jgi:hypothetical protein
MKVIDQINESGFFAQSAYSADTATNDSLGRNISETYQTTAGMTAYQPSGDYVTTPDLSGYATEQWVNDQSYMHEYMASAFYSADNPSGFITIDDISGKQDTLSFEYNNTAISAINTSALYDRSAHARITTLSNNKLNTTAFSTVSGSFLTAHQELPESANWNAAYNEVSTNSADWNSAAGMNELPVSAGEGIDIQNVGGNIVFSCTGGSVPEGVLVESGLEYNAVNEISGYSGSAFAQYGANKQWLQHDDTLVHVSNSAQYALGVNLSAVAQLLGIDETVLWSGAPTSTVTLSESMQNFDYLRLYFDLGANDRPKPVLSCRYSPVMTVSWAQGVANAFQTVAYISANPTAMKIVHTRQVALGNLTNTAAANTTGTIDETNSVNSITKVVGIGRKS